jgi:hypothetical protein
MIKLFILILLSNTTNIDKVKSIYLLTQVEEQSITYAIIRYETAHLQCAKKNIICSLDYNNLFGFRYQNGYLKFNDYASSIKYYQRWQKRHWTKYKRKHPSKSYYDFLKYIGYCNSMNDYIKVIKKIQRL